MQQYSLVVGWTVICVTLHLLRVGISNAPNVGMNHIYSKGIVIGAVPCSLDIWKKARDFTTEGVLHVVVLEPGTPLHMLQ